MFFFAADELVFNYREQHAWKCTSSVLHTWEATSLMSQICVTARSRINMPSWTLSAEWGSCCLMIKLNWHGFSVPYLNFWGKSQMWTRMILKLAWKCSAWILICCVYFPWCCPFPSFLLSFLCFKLGFGHGNKVCILLSTCGLVSEKALGQDKALLAKTADYCEVKVIANVYDTAHNCPLVVVATSSDSERESGCNRKEIFFNSKEFQSHKHITHKENFNLHILRQTPKTQTKYRPRRYHCLPWYNNSIWVPRQHYTPKLNKKKIHIPAKAKKPYFKSQIPPGKTTQHFHYVLPWLLKWQILEFEFMWN